MEQGFIEATEPGPICWNEGQLSLLLDRFLETVRFAVRYFMIDPLWWTTCIDIQGGIPSTACCHPCMAACGLTKKAGSLEPVGYGDIIVCIGCSVTRKWSDTHNTIVVTARVKQIRSDQYLDSSDCSRSGPKV